MRSARPVLPLPPCGDRRGTGSPRCRLSGIGIRTVSSMHQQPPSRPPVPHSNAVPQRAQARRREGNLESVCALIIVALLGVIAREINHPGVTGLRHRILRAAAFLAFSSPAAGMADAGIDDYDSGSALR